MNKDKKAKDERRNHIFAEAFDYLKRTQGIKTQQQLAKLMGVSAENVSRILRAHIDVTEETITRLQTASGCVFNLQWLRGESDVMLMSDVAANKQETTEDLPMLPDMSSLFNAVIAAKDEAISALKREIAAKDETVTALRNLLQTQNKAMTNKDEFIKSLQQQVADLQRELAKEKGLVDGYSFPKGVADNRHNISK